ncbi:MAG: RNA 2',3'-cyclic phosphodiesterase [bacterium]
MRLFAAIKIPENTGQAFTSIIKRLNYYIPNTKWVETNNIHLTLKFYGETDENILPHLIKKLSLAVISIPPFNLKIQSLGSFENHGRLVVWAGLYEPPELIKLVRNIEHASVRWFSKEKRPFKAHITLGRNRKTAAYAREKIKNIIASGLEDAHTFLCGGFYLIQSTLNPSCSVYENISYFQLGNN